MPEQEWPAKPVLVYYICDVCGAGNMVPTRNSMEMRDTDIVFHHECDKCGNHGIYADRYPVLKWRAVVQPDPPTVT